MSISGHTVRVNNLDLNVHIEGEGPAVLLLHGFPDSNALWRHLIPALSAAGYTVIAPDQRGFGESDAPAGVEHYRAATLVSDAIALLDALNISTAHLVGHDYGALVGWMLAGLHGERFLSYTALSVGHPAAYVAAGGKQKRMTRFRGFFLVRGLSEAILRAGNWMAFRRLVRHHPETTHWIKDLSRPGRLTAAINWYRANIRIISTATGVPRVGIPVMGVWSSQDLALAEDQMINSAQHVDNTFRYERLDGCSHWIPLDRPETTIALLLDFLTKQAKPSLAH
ncbi:MAG: alpha/beta hydrolase [Halioglobus sp.]